MILPGKWWPLGLGCLSWADGRCCLKAYGEGGALSCQDLIRSTAVLWSGMQAVGEACLAVVEECSGGSEAALCRDDAKWGLLEGSQCGPSHSIDSLRYSPSWPFLPFQVCSAAYSNVPERPPSGGCVLVRMGRRTY